MSDLSLARDLFAQKKVVQLIFGLFGLISLGLQADPLYEKNGLRVNSNIEGGAYYGDTDGTNFGFGRFDLRDADVDQDVHYSEFYVKPGIGFEYSLQNDSRFYGEIAGIGTSTGGDGDPAGYTNDDDDSFDIERLYLGWKNEMFDLSVGRQELKIGDGFLIWDGNFDAFDDAAYWLQPRFAFDKTAIARINTDKVHADLFWVEGDEDQGETQIAGANIELPTESYGTFALMYFNVTDVDNDFNSAVPRDGMDVFSARLSPFKLPNFENFTLRGEYVKQFGSGKGTDFEGDAWYVEPAYAFSNIKWSPTISYRYAYFSGDDDLTDNDSESFDPLFYGFGRGWGTWFQGEVAGEYLLFNSNMKSNMVKLDLFPTDTIGFGVIYYDFKLDENNYYGIPVSDDDFMDEINIYLDWYPNDNFWAGILYAKGNPDTAAEEVFGDDENFNLLQVYAGFSF